MAKQRPRTEPKSSPKTSSIPAVPLWLRNGAPVFIGVLLLLIYFGSLILEGAPPKAPDTTAADALGQMSADYHERTGEMPLWTPAVFSGMPSYGSIIYTLSEPITKPINWIAQGNFGIRLFLFFLIAGASLYILLIRYGRSRLAAFFAASVYVFTPYFPGLIAAGHNNKIWAAALIPPLLLVTDGLIRQRSIRAFLWFTLIAAWQLWVRHPQVTYYGVMLIGCIVLADVFVQRGNWITRLRRFGIDAGLIGGGLIVAVGITALPYLPVLEFTPHSVRGSSPSVATELMRQQGAEADRSWDFATQWSMHPKETVTFVVPSYYGLWNDPRYDQRTDLEAHTYWGYMPFTQSTHYFGLIPLLLAIMVRPNRWGVIWGCIGFSVTALIIGFGDWFPPLYWLAYTFLPMFAQFRVPSMIYMLLPLSVGIIAAWALDALMEASPARPKSTKASAPAQHPREEKIAIGAAIAVGVFVLGTIALSNGWSWAIRPQERAYPPQLLNALTALRGSMITSDMLIALLLTAIVIAGVWSVSRRRVKPVIFGVILVAATIGDLWRLDYVFFDALGPSAAADPVIKPRAVDAIRADAGIDSVFRIAPVNGITEDGRYVVQNTNMYGQWSLQSVAGYHAAKLRVYDDLMTVGGLESRAILDMLNARYIIGPPNLHAPNLEKLNDGNVVAYRNTSALPRAWWVANVLSVEKPSDALAAVIDPRFDPSNEAIVMNGDHIAVTTPIPETPPEITRWGFHEIVIETQTDGPAFLVLSEVYYPRGWRATIDGESVETFQTNFVLRGIEVPPGRHTIRFAFQSEAYLWGNIITWTLFPIVVVGIIVTELLAWRNRKRREGSTTEEGTNTV